MEQMQTASDINLYKMDDTEIQGKSEKEMEQIFNQKKENSIEKLKRENLKEIHSIASQIDLNDMNTVLKFGEQTAKEISSFADKILGQIRATNSEESNGMIKELADVMKELNIADFRTEEEKLGFFQKMFKKAQKTIEELLKHYDTVGGNIEKVYVRLKQYEFDIEKTNKMLQEMYVQITKYFLELQKYVIAGEMAVEEIETNIIPYQKNIVSNDDTDVLAKQKLNEYNQFLSALKQRVYDLKSAETIALQSLPMIKGIQEGNNNLIRKISSAFIVTLPILKNALIQAIAIKQQTQQSKGLSELDRVTEEAMKQSAEMFADGMKTTAELASKDSFDIASLERNMNTIIRGIEDVKTIQNTNEEARKEKTLRLEAMNKEIQKYI